ncbi:hypothetical protein ACOMHN_029648 [Nucella lapillus]
MNRSDYSHLYHDSHFSSASGVLDAREQLKAREVNAREQRLLHQQDKLLQQAKNICHRRHSFEVDSVRRDLYTILERTPTFDRSLKDEQRRMSIGQPLTLHGYAAECHVSNSHQNKQKGAVATFVPLPSSYKSFPKRAKIQLSPISAKRTDISNMHVVDKTAQTLGNRKVTNGSENPGVKLSGKKASTTHQDHPIRTRQAELEKVRHEETQKPGQVPPTAPNHRLPRPGDGKQNTFSPGPEPVQANSSLRDPLQSSADIPARKGALLHRRSHHAVMTIVRTKTRHELRKLQADVATGQGSSKRHFLANALSSSLTELSSVGSRNVHTNKDAAPGKRSFLEDPSALSAFSTSDDCRSKASWLSVPISLPDVAELGHNPPDLTAARARPRFYSADN